MRRPKVKLLLVCLFFSVLVFAPFSPLQKEACAACFWAFYEEYYDANWNLCGWYNSCTGERVFCPGAYTYRTQEIFPCC